VPCLVALLKGYIHLSPHVTS